MTYHAPTETNPPFTTPPTWPFPTTSDDWEPDYRLRLLEAAVIYLWSQGGTGPPGPQGPQGPAGPAGPATAGMYAAVGSAQPPTNGSTIVPPAGFLWVDTAASLPLQPYYPPNAPPASGFNSFTDPSGTVWISMNGSTWKQADGTLYSSAYRSAAWTSSASSTKVPLDTALDDVYSLFTPASNQITIPIPGLYTLLGRISCVATATAQWTSMFLVRNGVSIANTTVFASTNGAMIPVLAVVQRCSAGDVITMNEYTSVAGLTGGTGLTVTAMSATYIGPGGP